MLLTPSLTKNRHISLKQVSFFFFSNNFTMFGQSAMFGRFSGTEAILSPVHGGWGGWQMGQREDFWPCELISVCAIEFLGASRASEYLGQHYRTEPGAHPIRIHLAPKAPTNFPVPLPGLGLGSACSFIQPHLLPLPPSVPRFTVTHFSLQHTGYFN